MVPGGALPVSQSMLDPPSPRSRARFPESFGQRTLLTVDTEENFDWEAPFSADGYGLQHVMRLRKFQEFCEGLSVSPVYLVDWPIATSPMAVEMLGDAVRRGTAEIGIQLHPWVNPPMVEQINDRNSFAGNLPDGLERAKFMRLRDEIERRLDTNALIYRAGRYGLGPDTGAMLADEGIAIDTSVRTLFDYSDAGGPDYSAHPGWPYWADNRHRLLELPVTSVYWGMLRRQGRAVQSLCARIPYLGGILSRTAMLERIALTPEGVTAEEALRGIDIAIDDGLPLMVLSFHSPSLQPGHTPYVRTEDDLDELYDWFRRIYGYCRQRGIAPTTVAEIIGAVEKP